MTEYEYEGGMSKFNAGMLQMNRIHELQQKINLCNINPLAYNFLENAWNYEIILNTTTSLFKEVSPKLGDKENDYANRLKKTIEEGIMTCPFLDKNNKPILQRWIIFREALFQYEYLIKLLLDKHKMNSPSEDDDDDL